MSVFLSFLIKNEPLLESQCPEWSYQNKQNKARQSSPGKHIENKPNKVQPVTAGLQVVQGAFLAASLELKAWPAMASANQCILKQVQKETSCIHLLLWPAENLQHGKYFLGQCLAATNYCYATGAVRRNQIEMRVQILKCVF